MKYALRWSHLGQTAAAGQLGAAAEAPIPTVYLVHVLPGILAAEHVVHLFPLQMSPHGYLDPVSCCFSLPFSVGEELACFVMTHLYGHVGHTLARQLPLKL